MVAFNCGVATAISFPMFLKQTLTTYGDFCGQFCSEDWGDDQYMRSIYGSLNNLKRYESNSRYGSLRASICRSLPDY